MMGELDMRARRAEGPDFLRSNFSLGGLYYSIVEWTNDVMVISMVGQRIVATGIEINRSDVLRLWPVGDGHLAEDTDLPVAPQRGRPLKHDWADAAAFLTAYIVQNDPSQSDTVVALEDWFGTQGKILDHRSAERFVSRVFKRLREIRPAKFR